MTVAAPIASTRKDEACPSCGATIVEEYCARCGERRPSARHYSLREFAHEAFETVTNFDRSLLATLWTLMRRPGELTAAYMTGRRVPFLRPLQLFLLVNVVYFLWAGWQNVHVFNTQYRFQLTAPYSAITVPLGQRAQAASGLSPEAFAVAFDERSLVLARSLIFLLVPLMAIGVGLLQFHRRRPVLQHAVFSLHLMTGLLLLIMVSIYLVGFPMAALAMVLPGLDWQVQDLLMGVAMGLAIGTWVALAFRRAYGDGRWLSIAKAAGVVVTAIAAVTGFRLILFLVVIGSL